MTGADLTHRYLWEPGAVDQLMADERTGLDTGGNVVSQEVLWARRINKARCAIGEA